MNPNIEETKNLPLLALRGLTMFPGLMMSFDVERGQSVAALNRALKVDQLVFLVTQKDASVDAPEAEDIYHVGVVCRVRQQIHQPRGNVCRTLVEGLYRAQSSHVDVDGKCIMADVTPLPDTKDRIAPARNEAMLRNCLSLFEEYVHLNSEMINEQLINLFANPESAFVSYYIAHHVRLEPENKQRLLEELSPYRRLQLLCRLLNNELNILTIEKELNDAAQEAMNRGQREYYLREEMKVIQSELGEEGQIDDIDDYRVRINALPVDDDSKEKLLKELSRLAKQPFGSSEAAVLRGYLDVCLEIPWGVTTKETIDLAKARKILDDDHFGLEKVKERILEYLAVRQLSPEIRGGLLCLVGPPGTGKTSIAMSIARAVNRKLCRISLGGVHDEAEIRGHRKTYIGSMPGRIINGIVQAKSCNPVMVLDEIDKLASDYRGDPASALLEVLDAEQNSTFRDNFLEIPFDLSSVFFITTANTLDTIPRALLDRMEVIELHSYTDEEKLQIAKRHLLPKQRRKHGLKASQLKIDDAAMRELITLYTKESGVRVLEREISAVCRKAASGIAEDKFRSLTVKPGRVEEILGPAKYKQDRAEHADSVGLVHGLAYTSVGGEMLDVEVSVVDGTGKTELTGNLGDVMKESAKAAVTYIRSRVSQLGIDPEFYKNKDIHIHYPEGAVPKDGPSAGITTCTAVISALTGKKVRGDVAMTGEITLRGRVLPIGGLREKTMGALRSGIKTVILPADNLMDLEDIDQTVRASLSFIPVSHMDEVVEAVLVKTETDSFPVLPILGGKKEKSVVRQ